MISSQYRRFPFLIDSRENGAYSGAYWKAVVKRESYGEPDTDHQTLGRSLRVPIQAFFSSTDWNAPCWKGE